MTFTKPNVELVNIATPGKKIEYCARICYKSENNITEDSHVKFIKNLASSGHHSTLEHERKLFAFDTSIYEGELKKYFEYHHYFNVTFEGVNAFVSGNIRAWYEFLKDVDEQSSPTLKSLSTYLANDYPYLFKNFDIYLKCKYGTEAEKICEDLDDHISYSFKITGSRAFTHQAVRHRTLSFSQSSQRYCNYSGNKFGHSINFIEPFGNEEQVAKIKDFCKIAEDTYFALIESGAKPEDARQVLPNCTASEICMSGTKSDWKKFLHLRMDEKHAQKEIVDIANSVASYLHLTKADVGL